MRNFSITVLSLLFALGVLLASSCTGDKVTADEVRMIIGPYGGEVLGPKGTKLVFPPDALTYEVPIVLSEIPDGEEIGRASCRERV